MAQPIRDIHLYSHKTFETEANGDPSSVYLLLGVAVLVLLGAFVNYVNLTTAFPFLRSPPVLSVDRLA